MMKLPSVTVLMPVYNGEKYLREAIDSILQQTYTDFEFLIINDGSTDSSADIIKGYTDPRIRYVVNEKNLRLIATLNKGIELARGRYIARMDADDISMPQRLQLQYDFMESHPDVAICGSWFHTIGGTQRTVKYVNGHSNIMLKMLYQCHFCHPSVILRKEVLDTFDVKFDPQYLHAEDYDFFVRIGKQYKLANIQQVLVHYRHHEQSVSASNVQTQLDNSFRIKKLLFSDLGIEVSIEDMELFRKISQHEYSQAAGFVQKSRVLLERMVAANEQTGFMDKPFLRKAIAEMWFHICYNLGERKMFYSSPLVAYYPLDVKQQVKFYIKPFMK